MAGQRWGEMTDADKTRFNELADKEKVSYQKKLEQREKHGYFTFEDGTKSTDPKNAEKVKKEAKIKSKGNKDEESEEEVVQPKRALSAYTIFVKDFQPPEGTENLDRMKLAGAKWA